MSKSESGTDDDEYVSLSDRLRVKYSNEIADKIRKIENIQDYTDEPPSKKRRSIASWLDAKLNPTERTATGPGCSICISTFEEIQMDGKDVSCIII